MIFVLDATNKALKFTVSAGTDVHFTSHWADATTSGLTEGQTQGTSNGSTAVDAVAAPAASTRRVVKLITFHNTNTTTSRTVTLVNDVGGTSRTIAVFTLAPLETWYSDTAATTAIADGDKGDITVSGATWTIDNNAITTAKILDANVTFAKIADITSGNLLGRTSAGLGPVQQITPGTGVLAWLQTPTSANLAAAMSDETGSGLLVFATSPTIATPTFTGACTFAAGTVTAPALTTSGDTNTGIFFPSADTLGFATGGVEHLRISSVGNFAFGGTPLADSRIALAGNYPISNSARALRLAATVTHNVTGNIITVSSLPVIGQAGSPVSVASLFHYAINSSVVASGSTLSNQYGYYVDNMNTGLINYGYYSALDAGVNTNWNFYVAGTAPNYLNGNVGIRTTVFGTSAVGVLALGNATAPTTGPADTIQIYSSDLSAGNTMLSIYTEGTTVNANTTAAATHRIAIRVNGTVYYLLANTAA